jgi:hypothetical protein
MLVRFLKQYSVYSEGEVADVEDNHGAQLLDHGIAEPAGGQPQVRQAVVNNPPETRTANIEPQGG